MKVNAYYETVGFINKLWIASQLIKKDYRILDQKDFYKILSSEASFSIEITKWRKEKGEEDTCTLQFRKGIMEGHPAYAGPEWIELEEWEMIENNMRDRCIIKANDLADTLQRKLTDLELEKNLFPKDSSRIVISEIDYMIPGSRKMAKEARKTLKRYAEKPDLFYTQSFEEGSVVVERKWDRYYLDGKGWEIFQESTETLELSTNDYYFYFPLRVMYMSWQIRNLFPKGLSLEFLKTVDFSSPFLSTPLEDLKDMISQEVLRTLENNQVKEVGGSWWQRDEQEGIWINDIKYSDLK